MMPKPLIVLVTVVSAISCSEASTPVNPLTGVWQVQEIEFLSSTGSVVNEDPQPGQAIITEANYSLVWMPGAEGMRAFQERWRPSDAEKIQRYGEIVVNSGAYDFTDDSLLTLRPMISRVPEFMAGGRLVYSYRSNGDTLWLTSLDEYSFDGVQAPWAAAGNRVTLKLLRTESF